MGLEAAPFVPLALAWAAGLAAAAWLAVPGPWLIAGAAALLAASVLALALSRPGAATAALFGAVVALAMLRVHPHPPPPDSIEGLAGRGKVVVEGTLAAEPRRPAPDRARLLLDVEAVAEGEMRRSASGLVLLTIYGEIAVPLGEGQRLWAEVRLHPPSGFRNPGGFDYPAQLRRQGVVLVGSGRGDRLGALTPDAPPWPVAVRRWAVATMRARLPERSAALLAGLVLGERSALPPETDEAFRRAGVYHVLAVSGSNVALVAATVFVSLSLLGVPRRLTALVAGAVLAGFALVVGSQPSVLRATGMGLLVLLGLFLERESRVANALGLAALGLLVWRPADLWDPGFQLSFAATAGIVHAAPAVWEALEGRGTPAWLAVPVAVSLAAQAAVTPIMVAHFHQLSLAGVAANLAVVPLAGAATTLGLLATLADGLWGALGAALFEALWLLLLLLRAMVWLAASLPGAMVHLPAPGLLAVVAWYGALLLLPHAVPSCRARRVSVGLLAAAILLSAWPWLRPGDGRLRVAFLDVGQGDAVVIELPEGRRMLVDGGSGGAERFDAGERLVAPFLWSRPTRRLDVVVATHADADHAGGLAAIVRRFQVGEVWENGWWGPRSEDTRRAIERARIPRRVLRAGQRLWLGSALVSVLNPAGGCPEEEAAGAPASDNDRSLVLRLDWRGLSLLLTGDLGFAGEAAILARGPPARALVLKVAHHGSRFSTGQAFLEATRPAVAVISAGARNPFGHPAGETLRRLAASGARVHRTDRDGAVILESDGARLWTTRWGRGTTEVLELDPERTTAPGGGPEAVMGRAGAGARARASPRRCARTARAAAPALRDRDGCPGRAPSLPGSS
jgi:competence protein ComEC